MKHAKKKYKKAWVIHRRQNKTKLVNRNFPSRRPDVGLTRTKTLSHVFKMFKEPKETKYENNVAIIENINKKIETIK